MKISRFGLKSIYCALVLFLVGPVLGCMRFTERDYELQKKAYEREEAQRNLELQDRPVIRW